MVNSAQRESACRDAEQALAQRSYRLAHTLAMDVLKQDPSHAPAYFVLAMIAADHDNYGKAAEVLERAIGFDAGQARYHAHLGRCLTALNRPEQARSAALRAAALKPAEPLTLDTIGVVLSRAGYHAEAISFYQQAVAGSPSNASFQYNLGASKQFLGDFTGAEACYLRAIGNDPEHYRAYSSLAQLKRATPAANHITDLEQLFERVAGNADAALHLGHALAKELEDLDEFDRSFDWLERGKAAKRAALAHDPDRDTELFDAAVRASRTLRPGPGHDNAEPIFVLGMPRTGTTLVDRILSSHPGVFSAGELTAFALIAKRMTGTGSQLVLDRETLEAIPGLELAELGRRYIESTRPRTGHTGRFVDKMPLNFFYAAIINRALPNAHIICLRRHPMDACLSNFRQRFSSRFPYYDYAYSLTDTARYYAQFDRFVDLLRELLPANRFTEVSYDRLVADQEGESRRLIEFCGLPWDDACLAFHENAAAVATASSVQVRKPIYRTSSGRWQHYGESRLQPLRAILSQAGVELD